MEKEFLVARRDRGHHRHRGAEQDPRPGGEPQELPQGRGARGQGRAVRRRALSSRTSSRWATRRFSSAWTARRAPSTRRRSTSILPPEYSEVVYTGNNNDTPQLKKWHLDEKKEKQIRKDFAKAGKLPKILIVTEKLLTGFDAPILYAMYLDKPMRDHTLLQAIARVNRPYENEADGDGEAARLRARLRRHLRQAGEGAGVRQRRDQRHRQGPRAAQAALSRTRWSSKAPAYLDARHAELQRQGRGRPDRALPRQGPAQGVLQGVQGDRDALRDHLAGRVPAAVPRRLHDPVVDLRRGAQGRTRRRCTSTRHSSEKTNELVQKHIGATVMEQSDRIRED